mmetsp:Transcript_35398/g.113784  ORF Transcript_35398/g.113784 Transcript_35398/m.113784 type:complete len:241 (+) Transcript_35398:451-1173(+)
MVGLRRVAGRRPDALVLDLEHVVGRERLVGRVAPKLLAHLGVQQLGKGLGEAVRHRLHHDALVVVALGAQLGANLLAPKAARHGEAADVVLDARLLGGDKVGEREVVVVLALLLLPERVQHAAHRARAVRRVHLDVVADRIGRPDADDGAGLERLVLDDVGDERLAVGVQLLRLLAHRLVVEDLGVAAVGVLSAKLPDLEERVPVDVRQQLLERVVLVHLGADQLRRRRGHVLAPLDTEP